MISKARRIVVDGQTYRWKVTGPKSRYVNGAASSYWKAVVTVADMARHTTLLQCPIHHKTCLREPEIREGEPRLLASITPWMVERIIRAGLSGGWEGMQKGVLFMKDLLDLGEYATGDPVDEWII